MDDIFAEIEVGSDTTHLNRAVPAPEKIFEGAACPVRQKFYAMRALAPDNPYGWNDAKLFYRQAKFMETFTDDYTGRAEFSMRYPCFQRMGYERLRTYFTWRTDLRRGDFPLPPGVSYIFLFMYEMLATIGTPGPQSALAWLTLLRDSYSENFPVINDYLPAWLRDFHIYYNLPTDFSEFIYGENDPLLAWNEISSYNVLNSRFFAESTQNAKLLESCFAAVLRGLAAFCASKNLCLKDLFILTGNQEIPWVPFRRALFYHWLRQPDRRVELPGGDIYICAGNQWKTLHAVPYAHKKDLAAYIIKKTEALVREAANYKTKITADISTIFKARAALEGLGITAREIDREIDKHVTKFFFEKNRVIVNVKRENLERIREEAEDITGKLVVVEGEGDKNKFSGALPPNPHEGASPLDPGRLGEQLVKRATSPIMETAAPNESPAVTFADGLPFTETELHALRLILTEGGDIGKIKAFADSKGLMLEILVDGINEKAMDVLGDNILELGDRIVVYEEYRHLIG